VHQVAKYGLALDKKKRGNRKRTRNLIIAFICFIIALGSFSMIWFWRSLNYDFNNVFVQGDETTTAVVTTTEADSVHYDGTYTFLVAVTSDDGKASMFMNVITVNLGDKTIRVVPIDGGLKDKITNRTYDNLLVTNGVKSVVEALNTQYGISINKYVVLTETGYKSFFRTMGDITLRISQDVEYDTPDMFLELTRGENTLSPDKIYKYMKYLCETNKGYDRAKANADIIVAAFNAYYTPQRFNSADNTFSIIIDYCTTDISIVDFTGAKDELEYLLPQNSKEKLKVFVSDNITG
jgi:anionic cell wall polymer biosynthesis LytR-Cps2A-Psr (LCP) family protein